MGKYFNKILQVFNKDTEEVKIVTPPETDTEPIKKPVKKEKKILNLSFVLKDVRRRTAELSVPAMISIEDGILQAEMYSNWDKWIKPQDNKLRADTLKKYITKLLWDNKHDAKYINDWFK